MSTNNAVTASRPTPAQVAGYHRDGYLIVRSLFSKDEVDELRGRFERMRDDSQPPPDPAVWQRNRQSEDPLQRYPRVMMPHRWDPLCLRWLLDPRIREILTALLGEEPIAAQSMYYFKPPGSRGQALHQDNFYLQVEPHTCIAAWTAIDPSLPENGGLYVVPGTQGLALVCPEQADMTQSFVQHLVRPPPGLKPIPAEMNPGDTLFFNGNVIHGSDPNRSAVLWRQSFICHYMPASSRCISKFYFPLLGFDGREVFYPASTGGGPCGVEFKEPIYGA
jgi:ectoine hydroxylase-related dioxygenase (phytanoyl-CoA dioxygenase family)